MSFHIFPVKKLPHFPSQKAESKKAESAHLWCAHAQSNILHIKYDEKTDD